MKNSIVDKKGLVVGCGSIGERHLYNLKKIGVNIIICDINKKRVDELAKKYNVQKFYDLDSALSLEPDFSIICTYPDSHLMIAKDCIKANSHVFIEKPIAADLNGVKTMLKNASAKKKQIAVGYNLRFEKGLNLVKKKILNSEISTPLSVITEWGHNIKLWKKGTNYRNHYVLKKGNGIILDDSHEYDYLRWLLDDEVKSVYCQTRKMSSIKTQTESIATMILKFRRGTIASLVIDYVRPRYERKCHIIGERGDLKWEYVTSSLGWKNYDMKAHSIVTTRYTHVNTTERKNFVVRSNDMYITEMQNFIQSINENKKPLVDGWEGLKTLQIGIAALQSATKDKLIKL